MCVALTILFPFQSKSGRNGRKGHWAEVKPDLDAAMQSERLALALAHRRAWWWRGGVVACAHGRMGIGARVCMSARVCERACISVYGLLKVLL